MRYIAARTAFCRRHRIAFVAQHVAKYLRYGLVFSAYQRFAEYRRELVALLRHDGFKTRRVGVGSGKAQADQSWLGQIRKMHVAGHRFLIVVEHAGKHRLRIADYDKCAVLQCVFARKAVLEHREHHRAKHLLGLKRHSGH